MKEEQISDILYNALANMKEYMPVGHVNKNFTAIPNVCIAPLAKQLYKAFIQAQLDTLKDIDKMYHSQDKAHSLRLYIDHSSKLLEDE